MLTKYCSGDENEKNEMGPACSTYGARRDVIRVLVGNPERNRPFDIPRNRWEDNIKMNLQEVGCGGTEWIDLAQDRDRRRLRVHVVINRRVP